MHQSSFPANCNFMIFSQKHLWHVLLILLAQIQSFLTNYFCAIPHQSWIIIPFCEEQKDKYKNIHPWTNFIEHILMCVNVFPLSLSRWVKLSRFFLPLEKSSNLTLGSIITYLSNNLEYWRGKQTICTRDVLGT